MIVRRDGLGADMSIKYFFLLKENIVSLESLFCIEVEAAAL